MNQFKELTMLDHDYNVSYPHIIENGGRQPEHFKWFVWNKQIANIGKPNNPVIDQSLADPEKPNQKAIELVELNRTRR